MTGSVLCGVDGSNDSRIALRVAAQLSRQLGLRLVAAHVVQARMVAPGPGIVPSTVFATPAVELEAGGALLEGVVEEEGLANAERRVVYGFPSDSLADLADEEDAELIVVGSRGRGALRAAFVGSVSSELIGVARRPVLVVPRAATPAGLAGPRAVASA